ncbi:MAG: DEAD/DEAH box helicase [Saprospiraceae bacterium]
MTFDDLKLTKALRSSLEESGYVNLTNIQAQSFSPILSGVDVLGIAQTGTGKTIAYLLPCLNLWEFSKSNVPKILILVPTRELVTQVKEEVMKLIKYMSIRVCGVYGGTNLRTQAAEIQLGADILIGTPGRILDLTLNGYLILKEVKRVIIDEVDELLSLGFRPQLNRVFDLLPRKRQHLMFSATLTEEVEELISTFFTNTKKVEAAPPGTPLENIQLTNYKVPNFYTKINLLKFLLKKEEYKKNLIFCKSKNLANQVYDAITTEFTEKVGVIHSNKEQSHRFRMVNEFKSGQLNSLIATDIISRGIDIEDVSHVINFDLPESGEQFIHRIGRTGRADREGIAISFVTPSEEEMLLNIENFINKTIAVLDLPEEIVISEVLTEEEKPKKNTKEIKLKLPKKEDVNSAFHEKSKKNTKVNHRVSRREKMMTKYGKAQTRGQKKK